MTDTTRSKGLIRMALMGTAFIGLTIVLIVFQPGSPRKMSNSGSFEPSVTREASPPESVATTVETESTHKATYVEPNSSKTTSSEPDKASSIRDLTFVAISNLKSATTGEAPAPGEPGSLLYSVVQRSLANSASANAMKPAPGPTPVTTEPARSTQPRTPTARTYFVRPGDTLVSIAQELYGDVNMASALFTQNADVVPRPDSLRPGMILALPRR